MPKLAHSSAAGKSTEQPELNTPRKQVETVGRSKISSSKKSRIFKIVFARIGIMADVFFQIGSDKGVLDDGQGY